MNKIILLLGLICSMSSFSHFNNVSNEKVKVNEPVYASSTGLKTITPLASDFKNQYASGDPQVKYDSVTNSVSSLGGWDSNFLIHRDLPTRTSYYSLKTHVKAEQGDVNDSIIGFNIYYNFENYLNIYLKWDQGATNTIDEVVAFAHVSGQWNDVMNYSKYPEAWTGFTDSNKQFVDMWSDWGGFTKGGTRENPGDACNLREESRIMANEGFDMTLHVERIVHNDRLADLIQIEIDAYSQDGSTRTTFFSPKYAFDALTCPKGIGKSNFSHYPANIGFINNNTGRVTYNNIEFTYLDDTSTFTSDFDPLNSTSGTVTLNEETNLLKIENAAKSEMFIKGSNLDTTNNDYTAYYDVNLANGDINNGRIGFTSYYDSNNYINSYVNYNESGEFTGVSFDAKVNGVNNFYAARYPWDSSFTNCAAPYFLPYNDFKGYITNDPIPSGEDNNFNTMYTDPETSEVVLGKMKTIGIGLQVFRWYWIDHEVDVYQLSIKAVGLNNLEYTWYSPSICIDAFTFPGGGNKSALYDSTPSLGIYLNNVSKAEINNIKNNDNTINLYNSSEHSFGDRTEGDWTLTGSDNGSNWVINGDTFTQDYSNITVDSHYLEINALANNSEKNFSFGGVLTVSATSGNKSIAGLYPYYLNENNFILIHFLIENGNKYLALTAKHEGEDVSSSIAFKKEINDINLLEGTKIELEVKDDAINIYLDHCLRIFHTVDLTTINFATRNLSESKYGFNFYNASGSISSIKKQAERIYPIDLDTLPDPIISESGNRPNRAVVGSEVTLPNYVSENCLEETITNEVKVYDPSNNEVTVTDKKFTASTSGYYHVSVTTVDEWEQTSELYYSIAVLSSENADDSVVVYEGRIVNEATEHDEVSIPSFKAYDKNGTELNATITLLDPDGNSTTLTNSTTSFTAAKNGKYVINVTAGEGDAQVSFSYEIQVGRYVKPVTYIWQTGFVLSFFGIIAVGSVVLAILLIKKSKKEALEAEKLNEKNRKKALEDADAEE